MNDQPLIALTGLRTLDSLGLTWICRELGWERCETVSPADLSPGNPYDLIIASADVVAMYPQLHMGNHHKIVILVNAPVTGCGHRVISTQMDMAAIVEVLEQAASGIRMTRPSDILSAREIDVLRQIASGKTNKEIAEALCISINTAITHRKNIAAKLGIRSASGLSLYALMHGMVGGEMPS